MDDRSHLHVSPEAQGEQTERRDLRRVLARNSLEPPLSCWTVKDKKKKRVTAMKNNVLKTKEKVEAAEYVVLRSSCRCTRRMESNARPNVL